MTLPASPKSPSALGPLDRISGSAVGLSSLLTDARRTVMPMLATLFVVGCGSSGETFNPIDGSIGDRSNGDETVADDSQGDSGAADEAGAETGMEEGGGGSSDMDSLADAGADDVADGTDGQLAAEDAEGGPDASPGDVGNLGDGGKKSDGDAPFADSTTNTDADTASVSVGDSPGGDDDATSCNATLAPHDASCVIAETYGIFVSPLGSDTAGHGTRGAPFKTLGHAVPLAVTQGKRVYACGSAGPFTETLALSSASDGLGLFGGLSCATWAFDASAVATIAPTALAATGVALHVDAVTSLRMEDVQVRSPDQAAPGATSIAAFVNASTGVVFRRVAFVAGKGGDGGLGPSSVLARARWAAWRKWHRLRRVALSTRDGSWGGGHLRNDDHARRGRSRRKFWPNRGGWYARLFNPGGGRGPILL